MHHSSLHMDIKYTCNTFGYQASQKGQLTKHRQSVHEGKKYDCTQCVYQATQMGNLTSHKQAVNGGNSYKVRISYKVEGPSHNPPAVITCR